LTNVVAGIIERADRVLIGRRTPSQAHPLKWEFPGGKVESGERPEEALRRELREELEIEAQVGPEVERYEFAYPGKKPILLIFHEVNTFTGEPRNLIFQDIAWVPRRQLPDYDFLEGDVEFVKRLAAR
jgi:8-oxo-dGTP diphosphatase